MQFFDLKQQYLNLKAEIDAAVLGVLEKGVFIGGEEVEKFEKSMADYLGVKHAVSLNSGTDALFLSLKAIGIKEGDEVITTPFTFIATAEAIAACGAKPVFVDIDPKTFNLDPASLFIKLNELKKLNQLNKLKAVIPVHLFGQMADIAAIMEVAKKFDLKVIEDCAQALGASQEGSFEKREELEQQEERESASHEHSEGREELKQRESEKSINERKKSYLETCAASTKVKAGTVGDVGCFSFFPTKNLGAYGDGGLVATNNDELYEKMKLLKAHGSSPQDKYRHLCLGVNSRLDVIQAAILNVKIKHLDEWNQKRAEIAGYYDEALKDMDGLITPALNFGNIHVYHQYTIRVARREQLQKFLKEKVIPAMVYYSIPLHLQPAFGYLGHKPGDFPETECATKEVISLPIYPELEKKEQGVAIKAIKEFYGTKA